MSIYGHRFDNLIQEPYMPLSEGFFDKFKRKNKKSVNKAHNLKTANKTNNNDYSKLSKEEQEKVKEAYDKAITDFEKLAKSELSKLMKEKSFKEQLKKDIEYCNKHGWFDSEEEYKEYLNYIPPVKVDNYGDYWIIIDDDQDQCIMYSRICTELAKRLEKLTGYGIGTGDGDEGCIYPTDLFSVNDYYTKIYKKENKD